MFYNNVINHAACGPIPVGSTQVDLSKHERIYMPVVNASQMCSPLDSSVM